MGRLCRSRMDREARSDGRRKGIPMRKFLCLTALALAVACGGGSSDGGDATLSCTVGGVCWQVAKESGFTADDIATLQQDCAGTVGTTCSTSGAQPGSCYLDDFAAMSGVPIAGATANQYFYKPDWNLAEAMSSCSADGGTWDTSGFVTLSCTNAASGFCEQLIGIVSSGDAASFEADCGAGSVYAASACPGAGLVAGYCDVSDLGATYGAFMLFYSSSWTLADAEWMCGVAGGTWY